MKNKLTALALGIMFLIFSFFALQDYLSALPIAKDILVALFFLVLAILNFTDSTVNTSQRFDNKQDEQLTYLADHKTTTFLEWFSFCTFLILIIIYQFVNSNLIIGVIAIICLFYWSLIGLSKIIIHLLSIKK